MAVPALPVNDLLTLESLCASRQVAIVADERFVWRRLVDRELERGYSPPTRATCSPMVHLITPHYQRKRFFRPRRTGKVWRGVRRYQVLELFAFIGAIVLVWLGAHLDNQRTPWMTSEPAGVESASVELQVSVPTTTPRSL